MTFIMATWWLSAAAVGDVDWVIEVVQEHADDFTKTQRHDGQVVTP